METIEYEFTEKEMTQFRKQSYWRGFKACALIVAVLLVVGFVVWANIFIRING